MTTIVDEFVVTLGLDPTQYKKQTAELERQLERDKQTALKSGKLIEDSARKQRQAFNAVKVEALGFMSVIAGAGSLTAFAANTVKTDAAVGRLSATIGQSTKTISLWQAVLRGVGGTNQDAASALSTINQLGVDYRLGRLDPARAGILGQLGVAPGALDDPTAFSLSAAGAFKRLDPRIASDYLRRLGFADPYLAALQGGPAGLQGRLNAAGPLAEITAEDAGAAQDVERAGGRVVTAARGWGRRALGRVLPGITEAFDALADLIERPSAANAEVLAMAVIGGTGSAGTVRARQARQARGGGGVAGEIYNFWRAQGYSDAAARGIVAGMKAENDTFDPNRYNGQGSGAYGIGQWMGPRREDFKKWSGGKSIYGSSREDQLRFMAWELTNTYKKSGDRIRGAGTSVDALSEYIGGHGWGYMRPEAAGVIGDLERGKRYLAQTATVNIGTIVVNTQATDAKGIATGLWSAIPQANTGLH